MTTIDRLTVT